AHPLVLPSHPYLLVVLLTPPPPPSPLFPYTTLFRSPPAPTCRRPSSSSTARASCARRCSAQSCTWCAGAPTRSTGSSMTSRPTRSEEHTSELQSLTNLVCRLLPEKKKTESVLQHSST